MTDQIAGPFVNAQWLSQPSPVVAPALLGCWLVRRSLEGDCYRGLIVETEAYAPGDPACHAYRRKTLRNAAMFGPAGHLYVYLIYGMYYCLNIVTDQPNVGSAVLIRALALETLPDWVPERKRQKPHRVAAGPGLLCQALQIDRNHNGLPLDPTQDSPLWLEPATETLNPADVVQTTRIGISQGADIPWRWYIADHPAVSKR